MHLEAVWEWDWYDRIILYDGLVEATATESQEIRAMLDTRDMMRHGMPAVRLNDR